MKFLKRIPILVFISFISLCALFFVIPLYVQPGESEVTAAPADTKKPEITAKDHKIPITAYSQNDPAWSGYLYGGLDPMNAYGCGPTALAIAVSSLTDTPFTPVDAAKWSEENGCYSPGNGSAHALIPTGAASHGLHVEKLAQLTPDAFCDALSFDKLLILLMGPGDFSDSGHFIVAYGYDENGNILVADPASKERSDIHWPAETLISQLSTWAHDGGPVWALSRL